MHSLRLRLFGVIALVTAVALGVVGLFESRVTTVELESFTQAPISLHVDAIVRAIRLGLANADDRASPEALIQRTGEQWRARIVILDSSGALVAASSADLRAARYVLRSDGELHISAAAPGRAAAADELVLRGPVAHIDNIAKSGRAMLYVLPAKPPLAIAPAELAARINRTLWLSIGTGMIAALFAALLLSAQILKPIQGLTLAARRMAGGDLKTRVAAPGRDEIGVLGRAFNSMAAGLERVEELRMRLAADISHELRTPLTNIRGHIEAVQDGRLAADAACVASLHEEAMLLERLVNDLQDLTLADAGRLTLARKRVSVGPIVQSAIASFGDQFAARRIAATVVIPPDLPDVAADPARLRQILNNLITNAITHAGEGGTVTVEMQATVGMVECAVSNTGDPIAPLDLPHVFDRFYRADASRSRNTGGVGLGLAIVYDLVAAHGGRVWAENTLPSGVSVRFTLPEMST